MGIITCKEITKKFGNFTALNSVSLDIPQGKIFGLLGPNGAGKTTLIRIINQISLPDSGELFFNGKPVEPKDVERIGYLPEEDDFRLYDQTLIYRFSHHMPAK